MKLYKYVMFILLFSVVANATTLKEIIQSTLKNNNNIKALEIETKSKQKNFTSVENIYNPTATIGVNYSRLDLDTRSVQIGSTTNGFLKIGINLYDGGRNRSIKNQKKYEYKTSLLNMATNKKETILQIVTLFYQAKTIIDNINVFQEKEVALKAQYERMKTKYDIKMVTIDEVLKLQSEYETNRYTIEELKYQKTNLLENISLLANQNIETLDNSTLPKIQNMKFKKSENIEALEMVINAIDENVKTVSSANKAQLKVENILNYYNYDDYNDKMLNDLPEKQNQFNISLTYNLFDTTTKSKIEAVKLEKLASIQKLNYLKNQEKMRFNLAKKKLTTQQLKINSLKSAVEMGQSVYDMVKIKYQNGLVDNITYLDALSKKIYNQALYKEALNDYEIAKANYYFSSGVKFETMLMGNF